MRSYAWNGGGEGAAGKRPGDQEGAAPVQVTGKAWIKQGQGGHGKSPGR